MLKHIITRQCPRNCSYCITGKIKISQHFDLRLLNEVYSKLSKEHDAIMLTGGEPTSGDCFSLHIITARKYFKELHLITQNELVPKVGAYAESFNSVVFSIHESNGKIIVPKVTDNINTPIYAAILAHVYSDKLVRLLLKQGYSGLTINEEQRNGKSFIIHLPDMGKVFSLKVNRKGHCMDETIILPDYSVINDFRPYL